MVACKTIELIDVPTSEQRADFLTETIPGYFFWRHVIALMHACSLDKWF